MKKFMSILLIFAVMVGIGGCTLVPKEDDKPGFTFIEEMTPEDFDMFKLQVKILTRATTRELDITTHDANIVASVLETFAQAPLTDTIVELLQKLDITIDPLVADVIAIAHYEIKKHGGITIITDPDGTPRLTERSKELVLTIATGVREGVS